MKLQAPFSLDNEIGRRVSCNMVLMYAWAWIETVCQVLCEGERAQLRT